MCARWDPQAITGDKIMRLMSRWFSATLLMVLPIAISIVIARDASASTLDRINQSKTIRIAYREDAPPFSYKDKIGEPAGFRVDLCREVTKRLADQLHLPSLKVEYVSVTAADRFK